MTDQLVEAVSKLTLEAVLNIQFLRLVELSIASVADPSKY